MITENAYIDLAHTTIVNVEGERSEIIGFSYLDGEYKELPSSIFRKQFVPIEKDEACNILLGMISEGYTGLADLREELEFAGYNASDMFNAFKDELCVLNIL